MRPALQRWRRSGVSVWYNFRVNQNRIYTEYALISLPRKPYIHRIYMVLANCFLLLCLFWFGWLEWLVEM